MRSPFSFAPADLIVWAACAAFASVILGVGLGLAIYFMRIGAGARW